MANQDAVMYVVITIDNLRVIRIFPDPLMAKPGDALVWHCNPVPGQREVVGEFTITMGDPNPFEHRQRRGQIGGHTRKMSVRADAEAMPYAYHIEIEGQTIDPEIIIEQGPPDPPSRRKAKRSPKPRAKRRGKR
jgi:hypothetical protein